MQLASRWGSDSGPAEPMHIVNEVISAGRTETYHQDGGLAPEDVKWQWLMASGGLTYRLDNIKQECSSEV